MEWTAKKTADTPIRAVHPWMPHIIAIPGLPDAGITVRFSQNLPVPPRLPENPRLDTLQPYPFERLRGLLATKASSANHSERPLIDLSIGEPRHPTPPVVLNALQQPAALAGLASYPATAGQPALREAIARWIEQRHHTTLDPMTQVLPVNGSREALFAFAQAMLDPAPAGEQYVIAPNPFYQIYEGAALLAGARLWLLDQRPDNGFRMDWDSVPETILTRTRLVYVCSPGNPTGQVMNLDEWERLLALSKRYGFIIASDECYSEIYHNESPPPLGALAASHLLSNPDDFPPRLVVFSSLSKRSNVPGMRSGFVAGNANLIARFLRYRTYHGCAMSPMFQQASIAAWNDEAHVRENRRLYREKFDAVRHILRPLVPSLRIPAGGFYFWLPVPAGDDEAFAARLFHEAQVKVLPGSYLGRPSSHSPDDPHSNPGRGFVRIALVPPRDACEEGARRIAAYL